MIIILYMVKIIAVSINTYPLQFYHYFHTYPTPLVYIRKSSAKSPHIYPNRDCTNNRGVKGNFFFKNSFFSKISKKRSWIGWPILIFFCPFVIFNPEVAIIFFVQILLTNYICSHQKYSMEHLRFGTSFTISVFPN